MKLDSYKIQEDARKEMVGEATEDAKAHLKGLYEREAKTELALKNIRREIESYIKEIDENVVYQAAGVDVSKG